MLAQAFDGHTNESDVAGHDGSSDLACCLKGFGNSHMHSLKGDPLDFAIVLLLFTT